MRVRSIFSSKCLLYSTLSEGTARPQTPAFMLASLLRKTARKRRTRLSEEQRHFAELRKQILDRATQKQFAIENPVEVTIAFEQFSLDENLNKEAKKLRSLRKSASEKPRICDEPSISSTKELLRLLRLERDALKSLEIFNWTGKTLDFRYDKDSCQVMFEKLFDANLREEAEKLVTKIMAERCVCEDIGFFNWLIKRLGNAGMEDSAVMVFDRMHDFCTPTIESYNAILSALVRNGSYEAAINFFNKLSRSGISLTVDTFNSGIKALSRSGKISEATELFKSMRKKGFVANERSYGTLIKASCKYGFVEYAEQLLNEMIKKGMRLKSKVFISVIQGYCNLGDPKKAFQVFNEMLVAGFSLDVQTYSVLIHGMCRIGYVAQAREIFEQMIQRGCAPNVYTYCSLMAGYCKYRSMAEVINVFDGMLKRGITPNLVAFNILINGLCKERQMEKAVTMLDLMKSKGISPNVITFTTLIRGFWQVGDTGKATEILQKMPLYGCAPNRLTYTILLDAHLKKSQLAFAPDFKMELRQTADMIFQEMFKTDSSPDLVAYNVILFDICRDGKIGAITNILEEIWQRGFSPDVFTYSIIVEAFCKKGKTQQAKKMLKEMMMRGILPNVVTYTSIINVLCKEGQFPEVKGIFNQMLSHGCIPDRVTWGSLLNGCRQGVSTARGKIPSSERNISKEIDDVLDECLIPDVLDSLLDFLQTYFQTNRKKVLNAKGNIMGTIRHSFIKYIFKEDTNELQEACTKHHRVRNQIHGQDGQKPPQARKKSYGMRKKFVRNQQQSSQIKSAKNGRERLNDGKKSVNS